MLIEYMNSPHVSSQNIRITQNIEFNATQQAVYRYLYVAKITHDYKRRHSKGISQFTML